MSSLPRLGIDLGGTKIAALAMDYQGRTLWRHRIPSPRGDYSRTLAALIGMVTACEDALSSPVQVGVGIPGVVSRRSGLVKAANSFWLNDKPLEKDLGEALGRRVRTANDANCFALSEACDGAAAGHDLVFGVILGTGCGAGIAFRREVLPGRNGVSGEWGHNPLPRMTRDEYPGPACFCGQQGCVETFVSGTGLQRQYREKTGQALDGAGILAAAEQGDPDALAVRSAYLDQLGRALAHVVNILDPDCIVLGGGVSNADILYQTLPERIRAHVVGNEFDTPVVKHHHGDDSGVRGAAWLWEAQ